MGPLAAFCRHDIVSLQGTVFEPSHSQSLRLLERMLVDHGPGSELSFEKIMPWNRDWVASNLRYRLRHRVNGCPIRVPSREVQARFEVWWDVLPRRYRLEAFFPHL